MEMHKVEYTLNLTGSKLFDIVMFNTAKNLCTEYPGLQFEYDKKTIRISGELNDYWFAKYNAAMFEDGAEG